MPIQTPSLEPGAGILAFKTNRQLDEEKQREAGIFEAANTRYVDQLAAHCQKEWQRAREAKSELEETMLRSMRQREGVYSHKKLAAIREMGGSEIKMMLTDVKCRAAISWIQDVILGSGERPFSCEPTPMPEMPPEIEKMLEKEAFEQLQVMSSIIPDPADLRRRTQEFKDEVLAEAKKRAKIMAERMEEKIDDDYVHGELYEALGDCIDDFVTFPAAILKGPVVNAKRELQWMKSADPTRPNAAKAHVTTNYRRMYYCASPWDIYMTPEARTSEEGSLVERHRLSPSELYDFIGVPGYNEDKVRAALDDFADSGLKDWLWNDAERSRLENRPYETILADGSYIDTLEVWTKVKGAWLEEWGMPPIGDSEAWYDVCCWIIGDHVIRATLNDDPLRKRPYHFASYVPIRNSPFGRGVPQLMEDLQNMCDAAARAISNNMGIGSGPMVEIETDRLAAGEQITKVQPWRIYQTTASKTGGSPAIRFFQPPLVVETLMRTFEFFSNLADEYTGIPKYQYGNGDVGGAGETAAGLSMLMNASSKLMKGVIRALDRMIIKNTEYTHRHIMLFDDNFDKKGDVQIVARATQAILHKEAQQLRLNETIASTNNPIDFQIMGPKGRLELLKAQIAGIDSIDVDKVLPDNDDMLLQEFQQNMMLQAAMENNGGGAGGGNQGTPSQGAQQSPAATGETGV